MGLTPPIVLRSCPLVLPTKLGNDAHSPYFPEDGPLSPPLVVDAAHGPHHTDVTVGVATVEAVVVVQVQGDAESLLRRLGPLEDLFGPIHPGVNFLVNFLVKI